MSYRERRESDNRNDVRPLETRPDATVDLDAVRAGIGTALRTIHAGVLREEVPDRIAELLKQLEQQEADASGTSVGMGGGRHPARGRFGG